MNPVVHFEMPYEDHDRVSVFYEKAFGWKMNATSEAMGNYIVAHTTETDANNMVRKPGNINGGFFPKKPDWLAQVPSIVIAVDDLKAGMENVMQAGGKVLGEPIEIPGIGMYVSFTDTEGNRVSMLHPRTAG